MKKTNNKNDVKVTVVYTNALGMQVKVKKHMDEAELKNELHDKMIVVDKITA